MPSVTIWALSLHTCGKLRGDLRAMTDKQNNKTTLPHNEADPQIGLRTSDTSDRMKIKETLIKNYKDPLATDTYPPGLLNVVTCLHATNKVNEDESKIERQHYDTI